MTRQLRLRIIPALNMDPLEHVLVNLLGATLLDSPYCCFFAEYGITQASELTAINETRLATISFGVVTPVAGDGTSTTVRTFLLPAQHYWITKIITWFLAQGPNVTNATWFVLTPAMLEY
jgi:hypothetical protein